MKSHDLQFDVIENALELEEHSLFLGPLNLWPSPRLRRKCTVCLVQNTMRAMRLFHIAFDFPGIAKITRLQIVSIQSPPNASWFGVEHAYLSAAEARMAGWSPVSHCRELRG